VRPPLQDADQDQEDWEEEQNLVARLVHHLACQEAEGQYRLLLAVRRHFGQGGPRRLPHTLPPLVFSALRLVRQLQAQAAGGAMEGIDVALKKLFQVLPANLLARPAASAGRQRHAVLLRYGSSAGGAARAHTVSVPDGAGASRDPGRGGGAAAEPALRTERLGLRA